MAKSSASAVSKSKPKSAAAKPAKRTKATDETPSPKRATKPRAERPAKAARDEPAAEAPRREEPRPVSHVESKPPIEPARAEAPQAPRRDPPATPVSENAAPAARPAPSQAPSPNPAPVQPPRSLYQHRQPVGPGGGHGGSSEHSGQQYRPHQGYQSHQSQQSSPRPFQHTQPQASAMNNPNNGSNGPSSSSNGGGQAVMNSPQGGYQGGGQQGMQGMPGSGKKRRRKKKKGGGGPGMPGMGPGGMPGMGGGGGGGGGGGQHFSGGPSRYGVLPSDDELEREARELTERLGPKEYAEAFKSAPNISDLQRIGIEELHKIADKEGISDAHKFPRHELSFEILKRRAAQGGLMVAEGTLDITHEGFGFLRSPLFSYLPSPEDVFVSPQQIRRMGLRKGMELKGAVRPPRDGERFFALLRVDQVNGLDPSKLRSLPIFEDLTPLHPEKRYVLETSPDEIEMRIVDLVAPIGRGQRGLIVAPPRTGKTVLLQKMTKAISKNYPEVKVIVLLIDERPEEVTDFRRNTSPSVEVIASTFDEDSSRHVGVCEMVHEKSRRYVEFGQHVVILLDSITRLARAYNANMPHSGKIMTGGVDSNALQRPKKFFGNARAIENGGSLTILGTALVDTGSKADEVIFEEFKGTGNSELHLDRKLVDKRIWPAIDVAASGTRREELLLDPKELELTYRLRKVLSDMNVVEAMELMKSRLKKCKTNAEFLMSMQMGA